MKTLLLALAALLISTLHATAQTPGGAPAPLLWGKTEAATFRVSTGTGVQVFPLKNGGTSWLNFHPAMRFDGTAPGLRLSLGGGDLSSLSVGTVFQPADTLSEQCAWFLEKNARTRLLLSTDWLADFEGSRYFPLPKTAGSSTTLNTYTQARAKSAEPLASQILVLGERPALPDLPLEALSGVLPEIVVYDRMLSPQQQQCVESYFAIKYGLTLPDSYLSSTETIVWDVRKNAAFHRRIAGIGRDDASALLQLQSTSSHAPSLLTLSAGPLAASNAANSATLPDQTFLLCGDNGALLWPADPQPGSPRLLLRRWKMSASGSGALNASTELRFDPRLAVVPPLPPGHVWWLSVDRSGTGQFHPSQVRHIPAAASESGEVAVFPKLLWDADGSGSDMFALGSGPALLAQFWADVPVCSTGAAGRLHIGAAGGLPPYYFSVSGKGVDFQRQWLSETDAPTVLEGVGPGEYALTLTDATGRIFQEKTYVQPADAPTANLAPRYWLRPGEPLILHTAPQTGIGYAWSGPEGFQSSSSDVSITVPGLYCLSMERDGCVSRHDFEVLAPLGDRFRLLRLLPNPVAAGADFQLFIELDEAAPVEVSVTDAAGRTVWSHTLRGSDRYAHMSRVDAAAGTYQVTLRCADTMRALPLVVGR